MAAPGDRTIYDILREGWSRKVVSTSGNGQRGVNIPAEVVDDWNIEAGDDVAITESETRERTLEVQFEPDDE